MLGESIRECQFLSFLLVSQGFTQQFLQCSKTLNWKRKRGEKRDAYMRCLSLWWSGLSIMSCRDTGPLCDRQKESPPQNMDLQMPLFDLEI
jgi:hypothetical protein